MRATICKAISVSFVLCFTGYGAVQPGIGIVTADDDIYMNGAKTSGNGTVFEGATIESGAGDSRVHFVNGAQLRLSGGSQAEVFASHVDVRRGAVRIENYAARASGIVVRAETGSIATVALSNEGAVRVASVSGDVRVLNGSGGDIARIPAGRTLEFERRRDGESGAFSLTGCVFGAHDETFLTDETSNLTVQLRGDGLVTGQRIEIQGVSAPHLVASRPATQVVRVESLKRVSGGCGTSASRDGQKLQATIATAAVIAGVTAVVVGSTSGGVAGPTAVASPASGTPFQSLATGSGPGKHPVSSGRLGAFN